MVSRRLPAGHRWKQRYNIRSDQMRQIRKIKTSTGIVKNPVAIGLKECQQDYNQIHILEGRSGRVIKHTATEYGDDNQDSWTPKRCLVRGNYVGRLAQKMSFAVFIRKVGKFSMRTVKECPWPAHVAKKLSKIIEGTPDPLSKDIVGGNQGRFQRRKSTFDHIFTMKQILEIIFLLIPTQ